MDTCCRLSHHLHAYLYVFPVTDGIYVTRCFLVYCYICITTLTSVITTLTSANGRLLSSYYLSGLFEAIHEKKEEFGISSYGISMTTLEEVFLKLGMYSLFTCITCIYLYLPVFTCIYLLL